MKQRKYIDISQIKEGTKIYVIILDELPDGDGSVIFKGVDEVSCINSLGNFELFNTGLIATPSEIRRVYFKKSKK